MITSGYGVSGVLNIQHANFRQDGGLACHIYQRGHPYWGKLGFRVVECWVNSRMVTVSAEQSLMSTSCHPLC